MNHKTLLSEKLIRQITEKAAGTASKVGEPDKKIGSKTAWGSHWRGCECDIGSPHVNLFHHSRDTAASSMTGA